MPQQQTITTWFALNACNDDSPSGIADIRTHEPLFVGGLNEGDYFDLTEKEANTLSFEDVGILHSGRYRRVKVDKLATDTNVVKGKIGFMVAALAPDVNIVTSADKAEFPVRAVIFLNDIEPGKWGFVQELGIATVRLGGTVAAHAGLMANTSGLAVTGTTLPQFIGTSIDAGSSGHLIRVELFLPVLQG